MERRRTYPVLLFEQRADKWNASVKIEQIVPLFKKSDRRELWELQRGMPIADDKQNSCQSSREATSRLD